jgi:hypothetical protein
LSAIAVDVAIQIVGCRPITSVLPQLSGHSVTVAYAPRACCARLGAKQGEPMRDPRDIIYAAIHSAFVKYPKEDDPSWSDHWIQPEESAHLTKVVMLELEANGFEIVKKSA